MRSERVDAFAAALLSQRLAGGDLASLLRRFAAGAAERERVAEDARSATAQARFTGLLVVAMPSGGALFAELMQPGFLASLIASPPAAVLLALAAALQAGRVRRDPPLLAGGRVSAAGLLAAVAVLLGAAAARELPTGAPWLSAVGAAAADRRVAAREARLAPSCRRGAPAFSPPGGSRAAPPSWSSSAFPSPASSVPTPCGRAGRGGATGA